MDKLRILIVPISLPERLQTERLTLRAPRKADAALIFAAYTQDPEVARYMVWRPHQALRETEDFIAYCIEGWRSGRTRPYVITHRGDEEVPIGMLETFSSASGIASTASHPARFLTRGDQPHKATTMPQASVA